MNERQTLLLIANRSQLSATLQDGQDRQDEQDFSHKINSFK